jgi:hypothetical protein
MSVHFVFCVLCKQGPLRRADHSFRGVLPGVRVILCDPETSTEAA